MDPHRYLDAAKDAVICAGDELRRARRQPLHPTEKPDGSVVTSADTAAERAIFDILTKHDPSIRIHSEEAGLVGSAGHALWIVDPLDGTTNYARGLPDFAVAIALAVKDQIVLAVVHIPEADTTYTAISGHGAFRNNERLSLSGRLGLPPIVGTGFSSVASVRAQQSKVLQRLLSEPWSIREPGSASLGLCRVASGAYDAYLEFAIGPWDAVPGALIVSESGGNVAQWNGSPMSPRATSIVASTIDTYAQLRDVLGI